MNKRKRKLRIRILVLCLGTTIAALVLQTFLFAKLSSQRIYEQTKDESYAKLENMQNEIYLYIKSMENGLIEVYNEKQLMQDFKAEKSVSELKNVHSRDAYNLVMDNFNTSDMIVSLYLYTEDNQIISTYRRAMTPKHKYAEDIYESGDEMNTKVVKEYVESTNGTMLISSYYNPYRDTDIVRFVLKIYNNRLIDQKFGYIVCDVDSKVFQSIMEKYITDSTEYMWLQPLDDRTAVTVGNLDADDKKYYEKAVNRIQKQDMNDDSDKTLDYEGRVIFKVAQKNYPLDVYLLMPQALLEENQNVLIQSLLLIALITSAISVVMNIVFSETLTKPLANLTETMRRIKEGETHLRAKVGSNDEIGEVSARFNEMLDKVEELIGKEYEQKILLNQAEYKALQAQINPHFLYNTLDTMGSIANLANCSQVSRLCQSLSGIFRYCLDMKSPFSTISKEIAHLKNYTYVMDVRMDNEVEYSFEIEEDVMQETIPRMTLQPIVENALMHGLKNKRGEKKVEIVIKTTETELVIQIHDNGVGTDAEILNKMLWENKKEDVEKGKSIGLANINARLRMIYGEGHGVVVESKEGEGTTVFIRIQKEKEKENAFDKIEGREKNV